MSEAIRRLVNLAEHRGMNSQRGEWSDASVYWFDAFMPEDVRSAGHADASLDYFDSEGTPHDPAGEGFIDRNRKTAISFLLEIRS